MTRQPPQCSHPADDATSQASAGWGCWLEACGSEILWAGLSRPGWEGVLAEEMEGAVLKGSVRRPQAQVVKAHQQTGLVCLPWKGGAVSLKALPPLVFERQRLLPARFFPAADFHSLVHVIVQQCCQLPSEVDNWRLHGFAPPVSKGASRQRHVQKLMQACCRYLVQHYPKLAEKAKHHGLPICFPASKKAPAWVVQVCVLPEGALVAAAPAAHLIHPAAGGQPQLKRPFDAPSRSWLKLEETLLLLGELPQAHQKVVDLGAAPGGWSFAMAWRGCRVLAVDNGHINMKPFESLPGSCRILRKNGLSFQPSQGWLPTDWLLSDMLIPPGACLGLLKNWLPQSYAKRFVVNIKIPQKEPLPALQPIRAFMRGLPDCSWQLRQLHHNRREVTLFGRCHAPIR